MTFRWLFGLAASLLFLPTFGAIAQTSQEVPAPGYLTSEVCAECHADAVAMWQDSHHTWAWRLATDGAVLGDFNDATFELDGVTTTFTRQDGSFQIKTEGPDGGPTEFGVVGTVAVAPLQQYLLETEPGRLQALDIAWDDIDDRWYDLYPDAHLPHTDGLH